MGGRVILISNAPGRITNSMILAKQSYTTGYLSKVLRLNCSQPKKIGFWQKISIFSLNEPKECVSDSNSLDIYKSDITIILGEDFLLKYQR